MKKQFFKITTGLLFVTLPLTTLAVASDFSALVTQFMGYIKLLVPFIIALALLVFLWGIFKLVFAGGSEVDVKEGTKFMTWGVVSLFVMISVWGLVNILTKTFFNDNVVIPQLKTTMLVKKAV